MTGYKKKKNKKAYYKIQCNKSFYIKIFFFVASEYQSYLTKNARANLNIPQHWTDLSSIQLSKKNQFEYLFSNTTGYLRNITEYLTKKINFRIDCQKEICQGISKIKYPVIFELTSRVNSELVELNFLNNY